MHERAVVRFVVAGLRGERGAQIAHATTLLAGLVFLLWMNRNLWYYYDDWDFLAHRGLAGDGASIWSPHGEHWTTIPVLTYLAIGHVFGLGHPLVFALPMITAHLVVAHLLWRICLRAGVRTWTATALTTTFVFLGAGSENLFWSFQVTFVGSVAFGLGALLVVDRPTSVPSTGLPLGWALAVSSLMCSGLGLPIVVLVTLILLCRGEIARAFLFAGIPVLAYSVWYLTYGHDSMSPYLVTGRTWTYLDEFATRGLGYALETWVGIAGIGSVLILPLLFLGFSQVTRGGSTLTPGILCLGVFPLFLLFAVSRIGLGIDSGIAGRYAYVVVALALPAVAIALDQACAAKRMLLAGFAVSAMSTWIGMTTMVGHARAQMAFERPARQAISTAQILVDRDERILAHYLDPVHPYDPTLEQLIALNKRGLRIDPGHPSDQDILTNRFFLQTQLGAAVPGIPFMTLSSSGPTRPSPEAGKCTTFADANLTGDPNGGGAVRLVALKPTHIVVRLSDPSGVVAEKNYTVSRGQQFLTITARDVRVTIVIREKGLQVCG